MSAVKKCPKCDNTFPDQEYCTLCPGTRLVDMGIEGVSGSGTPTPDTGADTSAFAAEETEATDDLFLEFYDFDLLNPVTACQLLKMKITSVPTGIDKINVKFSPPHTCSFIGTPGEHDHCTLSLNKNGQFEGDFNFILSKEAHNGGWFRLDIAIDFIQNGTIVSQYTSSTQLKLLGIDLLGTNINPVVLNNHLGRVQLYVNSKNGAVTVDANILGLINGFNINAEGGHVAIVGGADIKENNNSSASASWSEVLTPVTIIPSPSIVQARLESTKGVTRIYCQPQVCIGREGDILTGDNKRISREHILLYCDDKDFFAQDISSLGSFRNDRLMPRQEKIMVQDGDHLGLPNPEKLKYKVQLPSDDCALLLTPMDDDSNEGYLLLKPGCKNPISHQGLSLLHSGQEFQYHDGTSWRPLKDGDVIQADGEDFLFLHGAYAR